MKSSLQLSSHFLKLLLLAALLLGLIAGCAPQETPVPPSATPSPEPTNTLVSLSGQEEVFLLSLVENGYAHLYLYSSEGRPITRLTDGYWNDITPSLSPDGRMVAFASNRGGHYDLYILDLQSGDIRQVTDTPEYDAAPSWSPDMTWLAFETYLDDNLEIAIQPLNDLQQPSVRLTEDSGADYSPAWNPQGRQIAFVSTRTGDSEVWLADLDKTDESRYVNLSRTPNATEDHPIWTADGSKLAWASSAHDGGFSGLYVWEADYPDRPAHWVGNGDWPAWDANGTRLITLVSTPNDNYLSAYSLDGSMLLQPTLLSGPLRGLIWGDPKLPDPLPASYQQANTRNPAPLWYPAVTPLGEGPEKRWALVELQDVQAPYPRLHDLVDEAFVALRQRIILESGWDVLANLENAFVPLTTPLDPGQGDDWLYTGRAFALNPVIANAGWMVVTRQDFGQQTYWNVYLRAQQQDGSRGEPLHAPPWDLSARYDLNPRLYEQGGQYGTVPSGYWIDFTLFATQYGWERLPALPNWHTYYGGARFTEFVMTGGLDWYDAMLELYPPDVLVTPSPVAPPTFTPTKTPYPTWTPRPTRTPGITPTLTPVPSLTPTSTDTPLPYLPTFAPDTATP
jgi:TolB protein